VTAHDDAITLPATGDVVFGNPHSPVAVCTLASRRLLPHFAGREEIAIAGRCQTENTGVERMVQNLVANPGLRYLILCGQETTHAVGQTILRLHRDGLDAAQRVVGSPAPDPVLPNLSAADLRAFQQHVQVVDLIGTLDVEHVRERARQLATAQNATESVVSADPASGDKAPPADREVVADQAASGAQAMPGVEHIVAVPDRQQDWEYDPTGFFLIFVDRARSRLLAEHHGQDHRLLRTIEGTTAQAISQTIVRLGLATVPAHLVYLGRELTKAELALMLGLRYEQDAPLDPRRPA
jgi:tetrahydromethanopterin S-methyltransferase subunit A